MAEAVIVACTHCGKKIKVPAKTLGKKIRCKGCEEVFVAKAVAKSEAAVPAKEEKAEKPAAPVNDFEIDKNPYLLRQDESNLPRCPFCAKELESEEAVICLNCGYNTRTRTRKETKAVYQPTAGEWFIHLLPGFAALLAVAGLITTIVFFILRMSTWLSGTFFEAEGSTPEKRNWNVHPGIITLWSCVFFIFLISKLARVAIRRLFIDYRPEEKRIDSDD